MYYFDHCLIIVLHEQGGLSVFLKYNLNVLSSLVLSLQNEAG